MTDQYVTAFRELIPQFEEETGIKITLDELGYVVKREVQLVVANPDHVICHLNDNSEIIMRLTVARGRGYSPADSRENPEEANRPKLTINYSAP